MAYLNRGNSGNHRAEAMKNISECKRAYERMYAGIETLRNNALAYNAFELSNRAMFMQRIHIAKQAEMARSCADRYPGDSDISTWLQDLDYSQEDDTNYRWRPFQLAFILMDVNSIVSDTSPEQSLVDLIWFPSGGGKTEAYLKRPQKVRQGKELSRGESLLSVNCRRQAL